MAINIIEIIGLFILPIILYWLGIIPVRFRFHTLSAIFLLSVILMIIERWDLSRAGIRVDNIQEAFPVYLIAALVGAFTIIISSRFLKLEPINGWWKNPVFISGFTIFSIMQEVAWRGFLMPKLEGIVASAILVITLNAFLFMLPHIIYTNKSINLILSFVGGLMFASIYYVYPNLILISILHMLLNFLTVLLGFFSLELRQYSEAE